MLTLLLMLKTKGKLNAVAPATSGVSADVSAIVTSSPLLPELETDWNASLGFWMVCWILV
jgi:hypothetical protein